MIQKVEKSNIIMIGGGELCNELLSYFLDSNRASCCPKFLGVVDLGVVDSGTRFAKSKGLVVVRKYEDILERDSANLVIVTIGDFLTKHIALSKKLSDIEIIDYAGAMSLANLIRIKKAEQKVIEKLKIETSKRDSVLEQFRLYSEKVMEIVIEDNSRLREIERRSIEQERMLFYIVQGTTIPTFVIDSDHLVTHWNSAVEKLTGYNALQMVGTCNQWKPFWRKPRATMADVILDKTNKDELESLYGEKWRRSDLIEGAYEAEMFFPKMGGSGRWLFFTAAPIKLSDGTVVGAIETLWDRTEKKKIEAERRRYTKKLEEKEKELAQIIQGGTAPTFVINKNHIITHWNRALEKLTGFPAKDMLGTKDHWKPFAVERQPLMADVILEKLSTGEMDLSNSTGWRKSSLIEDGYEHEVFYDAIGEEGKWLFFTAAPIKSSNNTVVCVIQTFWDVSAAKQAENERQRYTAELATLYSIYTALNAPVSLDIKIQNAIEEIREFIGASRLCLYMPDSEGNVDCQSFNSCVVETGFSVPQHESDLEVIKLVSETGKLHVLENDRSDCRKETSLAYVPISAKKRSGFGVMKITKNSGNFSSDDLYLLDLMGNRIGITLENSLLQEELERKSKFQTKLIKSANDGIIATDNKWSTVIFNPAAEKIFGYNADNFLDKNDIRDFFPQASLDILHNDSSISTKEAPSSWREMKITSSVGELIPVRFSGSILREKKKMIGAVAFFQDLRKIKQLEKEVMQAEKLATVGQTVAGMAHCIKNILHGFKGGRYLVDVGTNKNNIDKIRNGWGIIQKNIDRTSNLVMDLLSYSKEREPELEICDPNEIVNDVCELLTGLALKHDIDLVKICSEQVSQVVLDPRTVHRCIMNLATNAIDACLFDNQIGKKHRVVFSTAMKADKKIEFSVKDNGSGMTNDVKSKLFSSFFSTKGAKGTGLGLLVTAKLVEENNGSIEVVSEDGEGTTFTVRFPSNLELSSN